MQTVGVITLIINDSNVLIHSEEDLSPKDELTVIGEIPLEEGQKKEIGLEKIVYPKGEIYVVSKQGENIYLAALVLTRSQKKTVRKNPAFDILGGILGPTEEVWHDIPIKPKPEIDEDENLNLEFDKVISVGDKIYWPEHFL